MKLYVADTKRTGKGLFTGQNIKSGSLILKFNGKIVKFDYGGLGYGDYDSERWVGIDKNTWICLDKDDPVIFTNHSCNPNAFIKNKFELYALRDIKKDEEITFDYGTTEEDPNWKMECNCESKNCRKIIKGTAKF